MPTYINYLFGSGIRSRAVNMPDAPTRRIGDSVDHGCCRRLFSAPTRDIVKNIYSVWQVEWWDRQVPDSESEMNAQKLEFGAELEYCSTFALEICTYNVAKSRTTDSEPQRDWKHLSTRWRRVFDRAAFWLGRLQNPVLISRAKWTSDNRPIVKN